MVDSAVCNSFVNGTDLFSFAAIVNSDNLEPDASVAFDEEWTSLLSSIIGSYSYANSGTEGSIMLIIAWKFGRRSQLYPDFFNPTCLEEH